MKNRVHEEIMNMGNNPTNAIFFWHFSDTLQKQLQSKYNELRG
jgi:hypothetical protein